MRQKHVLRKDEKLTSLMQYRIFGTNIDSELEFPHWPKRVETSHAESNPVAIRLGSISRDWDDKIRPGAWYHVEPNHVFIRIDDVGRFLISDGCTVVYEAEGSNCNDAWLYVEGVITGALLHQRKIWPLHGCAVLKPNGAVAAFVGPRGIGKSTLLYELQRLDFPFLADDIVAITIDERNVPWVHPGFPQGKLCLDAVERFGLKIESLRSIGTPGKEKFSVPLHSPFVDSPKRLDEVFLLTQSESADIQCETIKGLQKLRLLSENTYRLEFVSNPMDFDLLFRNITCIAPHIEVSMVRRPSNGNSVEDLARFIISKWEATN